MCYDTRGMFDAYSSSGFGLATPFLFGNCRHSYLLGLNVGLFRNRPRKLNGRVRAQF
jgi:hypothetical protein